MRTLALALGLLLCGCAQGLHKAVKAAPPDLAVTAVFVYPFKFLGAPEPGWRSFEVTQRLLAVCVREAGDGLEFYGPGEFKVVRWEDDGAWVASTALPVLLRTGARADQGVVLRSSVEKRVASASQEALDAKGRRRGASATEETTWLGKVELLHPSSGQELVEITGEVTVDPFAEPTAEADFDPAPAFTRLMERLTREALGELKRHAAPRRAAPEHGLTLAVTPRTTLGWHEDGAASQEVEIFRMDELQAELFMQNRGRFLSPWITDPLPMTLARLQAGTYVVAAPAGGKLAPGDLIEEIDGAPALPHVLARLRFKGAPGLLKVRRGAGTQLEVVFP